MSASCWCQRKRLNDINEELAQQYDISNRVLVIKTMCYSRIKDRLCIYYIPYAHTAACTVKAQLGIAEAICYIVQVAVNIHLNRVQ